MEPGHDLGLKNPQFSLYIDAQLVYTGKMLYISQITGRANLPVALSVFFVDIGTALSCRNLPSSQHERGEAKQPCARGALSGLTRPSDPSDRS